MQLLEVSGAVKGIMPYHTPLHVSIRMNHHQALLFTTVYKQVALIMPLSPRGDKYLCHCINDISGAK